MRRIAPVEDPSRPIAGSSSVGRRRRRRRGDLGRARRSRIGVALDGAGDLFIADGNGSRIRRVDATTRIITTVAGRSATGYDTATASAAIDATSRRSERGRVRRAGALYIADTANAAIRRVDATGPITTMVGDIDPAGVGAGQRKATCSDPRAQLAVLLTPFTLVAAGTSRDASRRSRTTAQVAAAAGRYPQQVPTGTLARFRDSSFGDVGGIAFDASANAAYITEATNNRIDVVAIVDPANPATWTIAALADPTGSAGFADGAGSAALFRDPTGLYFDAGSRTLYVADTGNHVIRAIDLRRRRARR